VPSGATVEGVFDLTATAGVDFVAVHAVPGLPRSADRRRRGQAEHKVDALTRWDASRLVIVGGCFLSGALEARLTTRRNAEKHQATAALGFRCASMATRLDLARMILERDCRRICARRRSVTTRPRARGSIGGVRIRQAAGRQLRVITAYDYVTFIPAIDLEGSTVKELKPSRSSAGRCISGCSRRRVRCTREARAWHVHGRVPRRGAAASSLRQG